MNALNNFNNFNAQGAMNGGLNNNLFSMLNQFNTFKNNFQGDPKAQVQSLLQSGRMTQEQFNQFSLLANQMRSMIR